VALLLGAIAFLIRWFVDGRRELEPSFPRLEVAVLVVVGLVAMAPWVLRMRLEDRLGAAAAGISGRPVQVQCQSFAAAFFDPTANLGYVPFTASGDAIPRTLIKRNQCRDLARYLRSDKETPTHEQVVAVHVLTHESMHMAGVTNEAEAECLAVQHNAEMAERLGASPIAARELALSYWRNVYPRMPDEYRSSECTFEGAPAGITV
jgi:hypothetical protein